MFTVWELNEKNCALAMVDSLESGINNLEVVCGNFLVRKGKLHFKSSSCNPFPIPKRWLIKVLPVPPEKKFIFNGCSHFIPVQKKIAKWILNTFSNENFIEKELPGYTDIYANN